MNYVDEHKSGLNICHKIYFEICITLISYSKNFCIHYNVIISEKSKNPPERWSWCFRITSIFHPGKHPSYLTRSHRKNIIILIFFSLKWDIISSKHENTKRKISLSECTMWMDQMSGSNTSRECEFTLEYCCDIRRSYYTGRNRL